jgi:hypothetical protein
MKPMTMNIARTTLTILSFSVLFAALAPGAHAATCTPSNVAGNWGYTYTGTLFLPSGPAPLAAVGRYTADADGNISGTQTRSVAGATAQEVIKGVATLNPDCTSTTTVGVYDQSEKLLRTAVLAGVYVNNGKEIQSIFESLVLPDGTTLPVLITGDAKKQ